MRDAQPWRPTTTAVAAVALLALAVHANAAAPDTHAGHAPAPKDRQAMWAAALAKPPLAVGATFDARGRLWLATVADGRVYVRHSDDRGQSYSRPVAVNPEPEHVAADGENRPKIAVASDGGVHVSYTQSLAKPMTGHIRYSRSRDGGKSFSPPITVNDDREIISHRFEALGVAGDGRVFLAWLDKRDLHAAQQKDETYRGAAVYYAVSEDGGRSFKRNRKAADHSCECCRVAMALEADGTPVILWRHVFEPNVRDHALLRLDGRSTMARASHDDWRIDACPHHGPALAIGRDGTYHLAWYSGATEQRGLFYRASRDRGRTFSAPLAFGDPDAQAGHPQVLSLGPNVYLAWKEFDGQAAVVRAMVSGDDGRTWSAPRTLASAASASDRPLLISDGQAAYLSWNALEEGHRLIAIPADLDRR